MQNCRKDGRFGRNVLPQAETHCGVIMTFSLLCVFCRRCLFVCLCVCVCVFLWRFLAGGQPIPELQAQERQGGNHRVSPRQCSCCSLCLVSFKPVCLFCVLVMHHVPGTVWIYPPRRCSRDLNVAVDGKSLVRIPVLQEATVDLFLAMVRRGKRESVFFAQKNLGKNLQKLRVAGCPQLVR